MAKNYSCPAGQQRFLAETLDASVVNYKTDSELP